MTHIHLGIAYVRQRLRRRGGLLLCLLVMLAGIAQARPATAEPGAFTMTFPSGGGRSVYVSTTNYYGNEALTACATGYHLASLWEIVDTSNWRYAYEHPNALTKADSGHGPPSNWWGWVRTGYDSSTAETAGMANCAAWSTTAAGTYGSMVKLSNTWETAPGGIGPWQVGTWACGGIAPVWCVAEVYTTFLPVVSR